MFKSTAQMYRNLHTAEHILFNKKTLSVAYSAFDNETEWARVSVRLIEKELSILRKRTRALSQVSRALARFFKVIQKSREVKNDLV